MTPTFQFFEEVCLELDGKDQAVLPDDRFLSAAMLEDLQNEYKQPNGSEAVVQALSTLDEHFRKRQALRPFTCDLLTRTYTATDSSYISFIAAANQMRGVPTQSRNFEVSTAEWLAKRGMGSFHRVGWPRLRNSKLADFNAYLKTLGFNHVAFGKEKDGGLDILWVLPLGAIPHRPVVSFQVKNGSYDMTQAFASVGTGEMSLNCHRGLSGRVHTTCVLFNDYIHPSMLSPKPYNVVLLGLSDLASHQEPLTTTDAL